MYLNGMGFRAIERVTGIHHTTILNWVKQTAQELPEDEEDHPVVAELDELQTYVGRKTDCRLALDSHQSPCSWHSSYRSRRSQWSNFCQALAEN